jgi:hypothetical protein
LIARPTVVVSKLGELHHLQRGQQQPSSKAGVKPTSQLCFVGLSEWQRPGAFFLAR